jgi:Asp-tRNA(Asn)/Glu-tRNA(Gln) amidotransferase A subunit family amidase
MLLAYDLTPFKAPRVTGSALRAVAAVAEAPAAGALLAQKMLSDVGIPAFREQSVRTAPHVSLPEVQRNFPVSAPPSVEDAEVEGEPELDPQFLSASWLRARYLSRELSPVAVADRLLKWCKRNDGSPVPLRLFIAQDAADVLAQARAADDRYKRGTPLGLLDGIPVAVKDELDQQGYATTAGTRTRGREPATADAHVVARLRAEGALLIGKANMHELGLGVTGNNPHYGAVRNPYDPSRVAGGSSSGPAAAVAAGLCPIAVGADGGGSIRIPAALCGVVGLKATVGRVSERGAAELCWSVAHVGPIAATVGDAALGLAAMAGPDSGDPGTLGQPALDLRGWANDRVSGLRVGIYSPWFDDCEPGVRGVARQALNALTDAGVEIVEVTIEGLRLARAAHLVTIVSEMVEAHLSLGERAADLGPDTRLNLALARRLTAADYVHAQRARAQISRQLAQHFGDVCAIITPTTARTAPLLASDALECGESNLPVTEQLMRYVALANLSGLPAISVPCGYDGDGLPVGLHLMAGAWQERRLLRLGLEVERAAPRRRPGLWCDLRDDV